MRRYTVKTIHRNDNYSSVVFPNWLLWWLRRKSKLWDILFRCIPYTVHAENEKQAKEFANRQRARDEEHKQEGKPL